MPTRRTRAQRLAQMRAADERARLIPASLQVIILWGVPGTGKSTFAREWLKRRLGYRYIDTDAIALGRAKGTDRERLWTSSPEQFVADAVASKRPVAVEYGMWANEAGIVALRRLRELGASPWWFDGDRDAAFVRWQEENAKSARPFTDTKWNDVVAVIDQNQGRLVSFFGERVLRTIEAGPMNVPPNAIHARMLEVVELGG